MNITKSKYGLVLYKKDLSLAELKTLKSQLAVKPKSNNYNALAKPIILFKETNDKIYIPYYFGIEFFKSKNVNYTLKDKTINTTDSINNFIGNLRPEQEIILNTTLEHFQTDHRCLWNLRCGFGKSVLALKLVSILKKKTLIIVHKEFLMNQWLNYIHRFLPHASVGFIQQNTFEPDNDIIIGMLQSMSSRKYPKINNLGLTIIDEAHNIAATVFSQVLFRHSSVMMLGLSATPERKSDGLGCILEWTFGRFIESSASNPQKTIVKVIESETKIKESMIRFYNTLNIQDAINQLVSDNSRNKLVMSVIREYNSGDNFILIVTDRVAHAKKIQAGIPDSVLCIGGQKNKIDNVQVIVATYQMVKEGFDYPNLNVLIFATPKRDIVQIAGRIQRKIHNEPPIIIDIYDTCSVFKHWGFSRFKYYKECGFIIERDNGIETILQEETVINLDFVFSD